MTTTSTLPVRHRTWRERRGRAVLEEFDTELASVSRSSPQYIAWVQQSLNEVLGAKLAADGVLGAATRSAVRTFQGRNGLAVDGVVGAQTEARLAQSLRGLVARAGLAVCQRVRQPEVLDGFDFDRDVVKPRHQPQLSTIAACALAAQGAGQQTVVIRLVGHTDPVGSAAYNLDLGRRRAEKVRDSLRATLERLSPGLGAATKLVVESRGETQPVTGDPVRSRRVEVFLPPIVKGCPPHKAVVTIHLKVLFPPAVPIARMVSNMQSLYGAAGFRVDVGSTEDLNRIPGAPNLLDLDVGGPTTGCRHGLVTDEQRELFGHRTNVGPNDIAIYFVRTVDGLNGCAAHPPGQPSAVISNIASQWTLAHEVGHVLGLNHATGEPCDPECDRNPDSTTPPTRLMTCCGTDGLVSTPTLAPAESTTMDASPLTVTC
jgi:outer membrane protein OmpA-like peptidoglycan-associated protein